MAAATENELEMFHRRRGLLMAAATFRFLLSLITISVYFNIWLCCFFLRQSAFLCCWGLTHQWWNEHTADIILPRWLESSLVKPCRYGSLQTDQCHLLLSKKTNQLSSSQNSTTAISHAELIFQLNGLVFIGILTTLQWAFLIMKLGPLTIVQTDS